MPGLLIRSARAAAPNRLGVLVLAAHQPSRVSRHVVISLLRSRATRAWGR